MSNKLLCPTCDVMTSAIFRAYEDGRDCPYCGGKLNTPENAQHYYDQLPDDHRWPFKGTSPVIYKGGRRPTT